jgi:hypothetical protein
MERVLEVGRNLSALHTQHVKFSCLAPSPSLFATCSIRSVNFVRFAESGIQTWHSTNDLQ